MFNQLKKVKIAFHTKTIKTGTFLLLCISFIFTYFTFNIAHTKAQTNDLILNSRIKELEAQKQNNEKLISSLQADLEDLTQREDTLEKEIAKWQREIQQAKLSVQQAESLKKQFEEEKRRLEQEIQILTNQSRQIFLELQKNNLIGWMQIVITSENLGEALSKLYTFSSLQAEAEEIQKKLENKLVDKQKSIDGQNVAIKQALDAQAYAVSKETVVDSLLAQTQGDQARYQALVAQERAENAEIERQIAIAKAKAEAELEIKRKAREAELARIRQENKNNIQLDITGQERLNFSSNFCWFEADQELKAGKDFFTSPTTGVIQREFDNCSHDAIDISNAQGTEIKSAGQGEVLTAIASGYNGGYGSYILIKHQVGEQVAYTLYAHLSSVSVKAGDQVNKGQVIGKMGSTGFATGSHLHFMIMSGKNWDGVGCRIGGAAKCFRPSQYIDF